MRILAIMSSARKENQTYLVIRRIEAKLRQLDDQLEFLYVLLQDTDIETCSGCKWCYNTEETPCPHDDAIPNIANSMRNADGLIFAFPIYVENMSGLMKNFMDRVAYLCHDPAYCEKQALFVSTPGSAGDVNPLIMTSISIGAWGFQRFDKPGIVTNTGDFPKINQVTAQFYKSIEEKNTTPKAAGLVSRPGYRRYYPIKGSYGGRYWNGKMTS